MNKLRRKEIKKVVKKIKEVLYKVNNNIDVSELLLDIEEIKDSLESIKNDEEFAFDNIPESLQNSIRGEQMQENIELFEDAINSCDELIGEELKNSKEITITLTDIMDNINII